MSGDSLVLCHNNFPPLAGNGNSFQPGKLSDGLLMTTGTGKNRSIAAARYPPIFGAIHLLTECLRACESTIYFERLLCEDFA